ncbi:hypothetical protein OHD23_26255, partial [Escherichia coli]|nr:hypothetical protein [Escherichia coli]
ASVHLTVRDAKCAKKVRAQRPLYREEECRLNQPRQPATFKDAPAPLTPVKAGDRVGTLAQPSERLRIDQGINQITRQYKHQAMRRFIAPALTVPQWLK